MTFKCKFQSKEYFIEIKMLQNSGQHYSYISMNKRVENGQKTLRQLKENISDVKH